MLLAASTQMEVKELHKGIGWIKGGDFWLASGFSGTHHHEEHERLVVAGVIHEKKWKHHIGSEGGSRGLK